MKRYIIASLLCLSTFYAMAQKGTDSLIYRGLFLNKEFNIYLQLDLLRETIRVPGQEIFGLLPGFLGDNQDGRKWLITSAKVSGKKAKLAITNDYGSEDLTASLTQVNDSTIMLTQEEGSTIKIARDRKWVKLPKRIEFVRQK